MKKIVINADDFGLTEAVTLGILSGHKDGNISSTSLMVNMDFAEEAAKLSKDYSSLGLGIHLNVTIGKSISNPKEIKSLVDEKGYFYTSKDYNNGKVKVKEEELLKEFMAQISKFIEMVGHNPDHINCHHMYDFFGLFPNVTEKLINDYNVPMRLEVPHHAYKYPLAKKIDVLMNSKISEKEVCEYFEQNLQEKLIELPNHSGFVDLKLMEISSLNVGRVNDLHICKSEMVKNTLKKLGYEIVSWSQIV